MEAEAETPDAVALVKLDEVKERICSQFGTAVDKALSGDLQEVKSAHNVPPGIVENFVREEELEVPQGLNTEGKVGSSESIELSESPSLAIKASEEVLQPSIDNVDKAKTILIKTEAVVNGSQMQKDQMDGFVEETGDTSRDDKIDACDNQTLSKNSQYASEDNVGPLKSSAVTAEQNNDVNITAKLPTVPITSVSHDLNLQEEKSGGGGGTVMDDMKQKNDALFSLDHHLVENSGAVSVDQMATEIRASQIEAAKGVTSSKQEESAAQKSDDNQNFKSKEEESMVSNELVVNTKDEIIVEDLNTNNISIKDEEIMPGFEEEELECKASSTLEGMANSSGTTSKTEDRDDEKREGDDNPQHMLNDNKELAPGMKHGGQDFETNGLDDNLDRTPFEQVNEETKIVEAIADAEKDIKENNSSVKILNSISIGELQENESSKEDNEAKPEGEVKEELKFSEAVDKHSEKQSKEENGTIEELTTVPNKDENEVHERLKEVGEGEAKEKILDDETVIVNRVSIEEETIEDISQEHEAGKECAITREGQEMVELIVEDASVTDLSTTLSREELIKEIPGEDKLEVDEHEAEASKFNFPMESTFKVLDSTENEEALNTRDKEEQQKNHHVDLVIETTGEESAQKKSCEDLNNNSTGLNFKATENIDTKKIQDVEDLNMIQDADCTDEITGEEIPQKEIPGEDKMEAEEHKAKAKESNFPMASTSEVIDSTEKKEQLNSRDEEEKYLVDSITETTGDESVQENSGKDLHNILIGLNFKATELTENKEIINTQDLEDLNKIQDADCTDELTGQEQIEKPAEDETEAKEYNFPMESTSEIPESKEKEKTLNTRDEKEQQKNHHADPVTEIMGKESVQEKSSEGLNDTSTGLNFEATELTENIEIKDIKDVEDLSKIQDADCTDEIAKEEITQQENNEKHETSPSLVCQVSEEQRNEEVLKEEEGTNLNLSNTCLEKETENASLPETEQEGNKLIDMSEGIKTTEKNFTEETIEAELIDHFADAETQKEEVIASSDLASLEGNPSSVALNEEAECMGVALNEETELTENIEIKDIKDVEDLSKIQDADCIDEIAEEEITQQESNEKLETGPSLVCQVSEEERNEEVLKKEEGTNLDLSNTCLEKETEKASLPETEQEGNKLIDLSEGIETTEKSFTEETIKAELTDHFADDETQKEEVIASSDLASLEGNLSSVALNEETECLGVESQKKHVDSSTTHDEPRKGAKEITVVIPDAQVHEGNTDVPKEEHNLESIPMIKDSEITISQSQQEKTQDRETTVEVIQKCETDTMKHKKSGESGSTQVVDHSYAEECSSCVKTEKNQTSSTTFGTDGVEGELNHERNIAEDNAVNDQSTIPLKDKTICQSGIDEDENEQNEIKLEPKLEDGNQIQRRSVEPSTITIIQNEQVCDEPRIADVVEDAEITREKDNILKDVTSVRIGEETTDASTAEDKKESWKANGEVCGDLKYTEKELTQDSIVEENLINTVGDETVTENSHKDEKVSVSLDVARTEIDEHGTNGNDFNLDHSTMYDGEAAAKQSFQEDDNDKPEKEVSGEIESSVTSNDTREKIMEDDIFPEPFVASTDDFDISSHEEEVHVRLEPTIQDEAVEEYTLQELSNEESDTVSSEKLTTKESSHEAEVWEELKTYAAEEDGRNQTMEDGTGTSIPMVSVIERTPEVSSQEDKNVAKMPIAEVVKSDLEPTEGGNHYPTETELVSLEEEEDLKESLIDHETTEALLDELKTDSAGDNFANQTMDIHVVSEETTNRSSREDIKEVKPPGGEAEESDLLSIQGGANFAKETEEVSLEEEEDQRKSPVNFGTRAAPSEEITKMESNDKLLYTSIDSSTSDEQVIDESQVKTENTSNIHGSNSVTLLQEELSLHEAKTDEKIVDDSNLPSKEIFSTPIEESQDAVVEDAKHIESSNLAQNATQDTFPTENPEADEAKQEKSEILVEVSALETQLVHQDIETTTVSDKISNKPSSNDIAEEMPQESFMLETDKPMLDTFKMKEDISNECLVEDEMMDKNIEAPLLAQTKGETGIEKADHIILKQDSEMGTENFEPKSSIPEIEQENLISEPKVAAVILEKEKFMELDEFRESCGSESSDPGLKQSILDDEEKFTVPCGNMERDVQQEDHIKKLDKTLGESKKEFMKIEKMLVEVQAADHSHQINDSYHTTKDDSFLQQKLEAVDPSGEVTKATEAVDHDLCYEPLSEIEMVKDRENRKDQDAIPVEDHKVDQNIQEEDSDPRDLEEAGPKLDVEDQNDCMNDVNQPMTETNVNEELPRGVETVDESENVEKQSIEEEAACVEVSTDDTLVKEAKDSDSISTERTTETTDSNELTETRTSAHMEDQNNANAGTEASKEEILEQEDSEKLEEVSEVVSKVSEDNMEKEEKEKGDDTNNELQISPTIMATEEMNITKAENEAEKIVDVFQTSTEVENSKMDETIDTCIKGDNNDKTNLEKTSDMVSQLHTDEYENKDQKSVIGEKNINDILKSDIPVRNTEENSKEDKQSVEPITPDENIKVAEVENLDETIDNINITHSSAENISMGEAGEQHKEKSEFESGMDKEAFQSVSEDQIPERLVEVDKVEDTATTIIDVGRVKETFQKDKQGEYIKEAICESEAEDDKSKRTIEASKSTENETITEELPEQPENASATENNERQVVGKEHSVNHSGQVTYDEKSTKGSHEEEERKKDDVKQEVIELVDEDQIFEPNAEKDQGEDTFESKEAPKTEILNEEMMKGGHVTDQISVREVSVQENNHGEETKEAEVEEQYPTLVTEKLHDESKHVRDEEGKTNVITEEEVNQMIKSSDLVMVAQDISQAAEKINTVDVEDKEGKSWKLDAVPVKTAPSQEAPNELIHENITRYLERKGSEAEQATDSENFVELKKTSSSDFDTMSTSKELHTEDLSTDVLDASSVVKASQEEIKEKEGKSIKSEKKQEVAFVKKVTMEPNIPKEDNGKNIEHQAPAPEISNEGVEKINDLNIQEKLGVNEEGLSPLLKQDETPQDFKILDKSSDVIDEKKISEGDNNIAEKEEDISVKGIVVPSVPEGLMGSSLQTVEDEEGTQGEAQRNEPEVIEVDCEADQKMQDLDEETKLDSESSATKGAQLFDLLIISRKDTEQSGEKEELEIKEPLTVKEEHKTNERETDEEGEEENEHKKEDSGSDAPVMVEASRDIDVKQTPTKKSHSILSGVGSKVKHSISKVKKAITGKSSHHKQLSPPK